MTVNSFTGKYLRYIKDGVITLPSAKSYEFVRNDLEHFGYTQLAISDIIERLNQRRNLRGQIVPISKEGLRRIKAGCLEFWIANLMVIAIYHKYKDESPITQNNNRTLF